MNGVFPGSFDPPTRGHMDLIRRASAMCSQLTVTVMVNIAKKGTIPAEERVRMLKKACCDIPNVKIEKWDGLLADYMRARGGNTAVVRGVRNAAEFEQEAAAAALNKTLCPGLETIMIPAGDGMNQVSSSAVREIAAFGGDYGFLVPEEIREDIGRYLQK